LSFLLEPFGRVLSPAPSSHFVTVDNDELAELHDPPIFDDVDPGNLSRENSLQRELFEANQVGRFGKDVTGETLLMIAELRVKLLS